MAGEIRTPLYHSYSSLTLSETFLHSLRTVDVELDLGVKTTVQAYVYFTMSEDPMVQVKEGKAEFVDDYLLDMSKGELKPNFKGLEEQDKNKRRLSNLNYLSRLQVNECTCAN